MKKAIVAGHICADITPAFPNQNTKRISEILVPGRLINMDGVNVSTGGAVANTGLAMRLLGADVQLMGKIGKDDFGSLILQNLQKHGYDGTNNMIVSEESSTSYSVVLAIPGVDRIFLHDPGANNTFCYDDLDFEEISKAELFHFGYPPLMRKMYENNGEELIRIFKKVKELGVATSLDMTMVDANSEAGAVDWEHILSELLPYVDFFVPSVEELCFMIDRKKYDEWLSLANGGDVTEIIDFYNDIKPLGDKLLSMGAKIVLIKCGVPGLYLRTAQEKLLENIGKKIGLSSSLWQQKDCFEKSYIPDRILSGTGCGDTSIAAFLVSVLNGETPEMCLHYAAATGASCVTEYDALSGLKSLDELKKKIDSGWAKIG